MVEVDKTVTYLEMVEPGQLRPPAAPPEIVLVPVAGSVEDADRVRRLHDAIGRPHHWSRVGRDRQWWDQQLARPDRWDWITAVDGQDVGWASLTLDQTAAEVQITSFGLRPDAVARGYGGAFLTQIVRQAWQLLEGADANSSPGRVWLRTSSWDHPHAVANYLARGFEIVRRERHRQRPDTAHRQVTPIDAMPRWWVRPAAAVDAEAVGELLEELGYALPVTTVAQRLAEHAASPEGMVVVAVSDRDQILGVASGRVVAMFAEPATGFVRITSLSVSSEVRRAGIGQALVEFIEFAARQRGLGLLEVSSGRRPERDAAHRFYASLGFGDTSSVSIRYWKSLDP